MIEPQFLNLEELAKRWNQTPRQIIEHGVGLKLPLYFFFSGLAIDVHDNWHRDTGHRDVLRQQGVLKELVRGAEQQIRSNAYGQADQFNSMTPDQVVELRSTINGWEAEFEELDHKLQVRELERRGFEYRDVLRLAPATMLELLASEEVAFPHFAYHPQSPVSLAESERGLVLDGRIVALESCPGSPWKAKLARADVLVQLLDIKAIEEPGEFAGTAKPLTRSEAQDNAIIEMLKSLALDPQSLPLNAPGKPGVKAEAWSMLAKRKDIFQSRKVFEHAWDRLRANGGIANKPSSP